MSELQNMNRIGSDLVDIQFCKVAGLTQNWLISVLSAGNNFKTFTVLSGVLIISEMCEMLHVNVRH